MQEEAASGAQDGPAAGYTVLAAADPALNGGRTEVVFIESNLSDRPTLVAGIRAGVEVVVLDSSGDGLAQMAQWAAGRDGYDAIHVISHGAEGQVHLGSLTLDAATAAGRTADLAALGAALNDDGDLLLYGCKTAADGAGRALLATVAAATGADVAASTDGTGAAGLAGDWELEARTGPVAASGALTTDGMAGYGHRLATYIVNTNLDSGDDATVSDLATDQADGGGLSLREALSYATSSGDIVQFAAGLDGQTITLGSNVTVAAGVIFDGDPAGAREQVRLGAVVHPRRAVLGETPQLPVHDRLVDDLVGPADVERARVLALFLLAAEAAAAVLEPARASGWGGGVGGRGTPGRRTRARRGARRRRPRRRRARGGRGRRCARGSRPRRPRACATCATPCT